MHRITSREASSLLRGVKTGPRTRSVYYPVGTQGSFTEDNVTGVTSDTLLCPVSNCGAIPSLPHTSYVLVPKRRDKVILPLEWF